MYRNCDDAHPSKQYIPSLRLHCREDDSFFYKFHFSVHDYFSIWHVRWLLRKSKKRKSELGGFGVPILAADVPAIRDYAGESQGVESYIPYNVENLREKLVGMSIKSEAALAEMGEANITAIKTTLSEQEMAKTIEMICERIYYGGKR